MLSSLTKPQRKSLRGTIFVLILGVISIVPTKSLKTVFTDDDIRTAVDNRDNGEYGPISQWDVSHVTDMSHMFYYADAFNGDLSDWDVSRVTNMFGMFAYASAFNGDLSDWDVSRVADMSWMFKFAASFNGDLSAWDVSQVTDMSHMFYYADAFNGDLSDWDVSQSTNLGAMFYFASAFNQDLSDWDVSRVTDMGFMFSSASSFQDALCWDLHPYVNTAHMFIGTKSDGFDCSTESPSAGPTPAISKKCTDKYNRLFNIWKFTSTCETLSKLSIFKRDKWCKSTSVFRKCPDTCDGMCICNDNGFDCSTESPSAAPTPAISKKCTDKYNRLFNIWNFIGTCKILSKLSVSKRDKWCKSSSVFRACPDTCNGVCICNDNTLSIFVLYKGRKNCSWLIGQTLNKKRFLCRKFPQVKDACEGTCNGWC